MGNGGLEPMKTMIKTALCLGSLLGAAVIGSGCSQAPVPKDTFYRLELAPAVAVVATPKISGAVEVRPFSADGLLSQRAIVYQDLKGGVNAADAPFEQYSYHFWAEQPTIALQLALNNYLRESGLFKTVVTPELRVLVDYEIQGRIIHLEQQRGPDGAVMDITLELSLTQRKGLNLILLKTYHVQQTARDAGVQATAEAARQGLYILFGQFVADIAALDSGKISPKL